MVKVQETLFSSDYMPKEKCFIEFMSHQVFSFWKIANSLRVERGECKHLFIDIRFDTFWRNVAIFLGIWLKLFLCKYFFAILD